jgi:hypothetical protein
VAYVDAYLEALSSIPSAREAKPQGNEVAARIVRDLARSHAPAKRWLSLTFGEPIAERALRLLWREVR